MKQTKKYFEFLPQALMILVLTAGFMYFAVNSYKKFWNQPTTTKIYYTLGDKDSTIKFPLVSICNYDFALLNPVLNKCGNGSDRFIRTLSNCYKNDTSFKIDEFMKSLDHAKR